MKITLPKSKYVLELRDFLSNRLFRQYQRMLVDDADIAGTGDVGIKIKVGKIYEAQDFILEHSIISLTDSEGKVFEKPFDEVMELSIEDGNFVYQKIQELIGGSTMDEKVKKNG